MVYLNTMKFIHTADLHLDSPFKRLNDLPQAIFNKIKESSFRSFERIISYAIKEKVDFVLISGDLFDDENRSLTSQVYVRNQFERLQSHGIQVYMIHGNHDHLGGKWANITWPDNTHVFADHVEVKAYEKEGKVMAYIYGFSYEQRVITKNMTNHYIKKDGALFHIGLLHGNLEGKEDHDPYAPFTIQQLLDRNLDYWALGHIHKRQIIHENPPIIYPGNIQGRHGKELGQKGCYIIEMHENKINSSFYPSAEIIWESKDIFIDPFDSADQLIEEIKTEKEELRRSHRSTFLILKLKGYGKLHSIVNEEGFIKELLEIINEGEEEEEHFVWITECKLNTFLPYNRNELKEGAHFVRDLLEQIDAYDDPFMLEALSPLYKNRKLSSYIEVLSDEDKQDLIQRAEKYLLQELLKQ